MVNGFRIALSVFLHLLHLTDNWLCALFVALSSVLDVDGLLLNEKQQRDIY